MKIYEKPILVIDFVDNFDVITASDNYVDDPDWGMSTDLPSIG